VVAVLLLMLAAGAYAAAAAAAAAVGGAGGAAQPRGHIEVTAVLATSGTMEVHLLAEPPAGLLPARGTDAFLELLDQLCSSGGWQGSVKSVAAADRDVTTIEASGKYLTPPAGAIPQALAAGDSAVEWTCRSYLFLTLHRVQIQLQPSEQLLSLLAPLGSEAGTPTFALFVKLPGRVFQTDAEARSAQGLYWAWNGDPASMVSAAAGAVELHPLPAGLGLLGALTFAGAGAVAHDFWSRRRAKHVRRRRAGGVT
jgi:hypothetical protein